MIWDINKMKTKTFAFASVVILAFVLLSACIAGTGNDPLAGTSWKLVSLNDMPVLKGPELTIRFSDGQIAGSSGCNSFGGSYKINGQKLTTSSMVSTMMACVDPGLMDQEQSFLGYLQDARSFKLSADQLQIFHLNGKALTFVPQ
jgi:heat shock protein HslJ